MTDTERIEMLEKERAEEHQRLKYCEWVVDDEGQPSQVVRGYLKEANEHRTRIREIDQQLSHLRGKTE